MVVFNGTVKIKIIEAENLKPTEWSTRISKLVSVQKQQQQTTLDPYVSIDIDEYHVNNSTTKTKTCSPKWDEDFSSEVHNGESIGFTVFHKTIPVDDFVSNCRLNFEDLDKEINDCWVSLKFTKKLKISLFDVVVFFERNYQVCGVDIQYQYCILFSQLFI